MLNSANAERRQLLDRLLNKDIQEEPVKLGEEEPITPKFVPWSVKKQMLEDADRAAARVMAQRQKELKNDPDQKKVEELEKELGVN